MEKVRYLRFDQDIWSQTDITVFHKLILNHIRGFEDKGLPCFTKLEALSELYGMPLQMVEDVFKDLVKKHYLSMYNDGKHTYLNIIWKKPQTLTKAIEDIFQV
jgi:hypothetical protein